MSDLISREKALDGLKYEMKYGAEIDRCGLDTAYDIIENVPSAEPERKWTAHEVASILAELFGDDCACDYCGLDEWLPEKCDFGTLCPDKDLCGVTCWEQYLKHRGDHE